MSAVRHLQPAITPRGLARESAARYVGVGVTKFDEMVADKRMPPPKLIDRRKLWDREALDMAFDALPSEEPVNLFAKILHGQG